MPPRRHFAVIHPLWGYGFHYKCDPDTIAEYLVSETFLKLHVKDSLASTSLVQLVRQAQALQQTVHQDRRNCAGEVQEEAKEKTDDEIEHFREWLCKALGRDFYLMDWFHLASQVRLLPCVKCWLQDENAADELDELLSATTAKQRKIMEGCSDDDQATASLGSIFWCTGFWWNRSDPVLPNHMDPVPVLRTRITPANPAPLTAALISP